MNLKKIITLSLGDIKNIARDYMLLLSLSAPVLISLVARYLIPYVNLILVENTNIDLQIHYPFILGFFLLLTPMLIGTLTGFIILEERDENILSYIAVTPLTKSGYLIYRILSPVIISFLLSFFVLTFSGLVPVYLYKSILIILMASLEGL